MKLTDVAVGETIVYEDRENHKQATPYKVLATKVPIEWIKDEPDPKHPERRLYTRPHLSPDTVAGLGVTVGLGSGGRPMPVSMKGRNWRDQPRTGVLAMQMGWDDEPVTYEATAIGGRTASFCVLTSGHDFQPYDEFRSWWRSRSDFSLRFADNKDRPGWVAYAYPQPPDEGDGGLAVGSQRNYFGIDEVPLHPKLLKVVFRKRGEPYDDTVERPWLSAPIEKGFVVVVDDDGAEFRIDPIHLVADPMGRVFESIRQREESRATSGATERVYDAIVRVARQVSPDKRNLGVSVSNEYVMMPPAVLEAMLFGHEDVTADVLDGIAELRDTLADMRASR